MKNQQRVFSTAMKKVSTKFNDGDDDVDIDVNVDDTLTLRQEKESHTL